MKISNKHIFAKPITIFMIAVMALVTFFFYNTPVRSHIEDYFFDIRTILKPTLSTSNNVMIIKIDDSTIKRLEGEGKDNISFDTYLRILQALKLSEPSAIAAILPSNIFDYSNPKIFDIASLVSSDTRFFLGTLNYNASSASLLDLPDGLKEIRSQVFGIDTLRKRSTSVIRYLPFSSYQKDQEVLMLAPAIAKHLTGMFGEIGENYYLNYKRHSEFYTVDAADFLASQSTFQELIKQKVVVLGYTTFRKWNFAVFDQMNANTPVIGDYNTYKKGDSLAFITANAIDNLITKRWLHEAPVVVNIIQTTFFALLCLLIWRLKTLTASLSLFMLWWGLLAIHVLLFSFSNWLIPLADTFAFSSLTTLIGAILKLQNNLAMFAKEQAKTASKREIAGIQSRFLDDFANELSEMNQDIKSEISTVTLEENAPSFVQDTLDMTLESCNDFSEYLSGVIRFSEVESGKFVKPTMTSVSLHPLARRVLRRFDQKIQEKSILLELNCPQDLQHKTSEQIIDTILFNLVSNAVKYSPENTNVSVTISKAGGKLTLSVKDEGPGIAEEFRQRIFERFYRIKNDDVYKVKGTGIGLYLCVYFAKLVNAKLSLATETGKGSTFTLVL